MIINPYRFGGGPKANELLNSKLIGGPPPTNWPLGSSITGTGTVIADGDHNRYRFAGTGQRYWFKQDLPVLAGETWTFSFMVHAINATMSSDRVVDFNGVNRTIITELLGNQLVAGQRAKHTVLFTQDGTVACRWGLGAISVANGSYDGSRPKAEKSSGDTGYLATS